MSTSLRVKLRGAVTKHPHVRGHTHTYFAHSRHRSESRSDQIRRCAMLHERTLYPPTRAPRGQSSAKRVYCACARSRWGIMTNDACCNPASEQRIIYTYIYANVRRSYCYQTTHPAPAVDDVRGSPHTTFMLHDLRHDLTRRNH